MRKTCASLCESSVWSKKIDGLIKGGAMQKLLIYLLSLKWLREGRIDGIVIEANSTMGVGFESELWLRKWIEKNKNIEL